MSINSCFSTIIGFSRNEDLCVDGWDPSYAVSDSGLYMDELQGMSLRIIDSLGGKNDIWQKFAVARENAINVFKTDVFAEILKYNEYRRLKFTGDIGHRRFDHLLTKDTYHGMRMFSEVRGGEFTLRGITLNLNTTENVDVFIYDDFELLDTVTVSSIADKPSYTAITPITLDLQGNLYFIYAPAGTPYNNKMTCGCGGYKWCFDLDSPCFKSSRDNWTIWAMVGGIHGDDIAVREDWGVSYYAQGMRLHGEFKCELTNILCSDSSDFQNNEIDQAIAHAIRYKAAEFLTYDIKNSLEVSRITLIGNDEVFSTNMAYYSERYSALINFIAENIEPDRSDCLICRPALGISKTSQYL